MVRQAVINGDPYLLYHFIKQYEGILFSSVTLTPFGETAYYINMDRIGSDSGYNIYMALNDDPAERVNYAAAEALKASAASTGATLVNQFDYVYGTDNGLMLHFTYDTINGVPNLFTTVLITSGSDGNYFVIVSNPGTSPSNNDLTHLTAKIKHYGDADTLTFTMCQFDTEMQTLAVPFAGMGSAAEVSYAKHAFWMPVSNSYGSGFNRMSFQDIECVTNGYWFLDDKPDEEVA